jgi:chromosome segregation ATPase
MATKKNTKVQPSKQSEKELVKMERLNFGEKILKSQLREERKKATERLRRFADLRRKTDEELKELLRRTVEQGRRIHAAHSQAVDRTNSLLKQLEKSEANIKQIKAAIIKATKLKRKHGKESWERINGLISRLNVKLKRYNQKKREINAELKKLLPKFKEQDEKYEKLEKRADKIEAMLA